MIGPRPETQADLLKVWEAWLSPKSPYLKKLRAVNPETIFHEWGGGLPGKRGMLPFCMTATLHGETREITKASDLEGLK